MARWTGLVSAIGFALVAVPASAAALGEAGGSGRWTAISAITPGLPHHTLYHPRQFPADALPLYVWGNGACRDNGLAHAAYLREIASRGYFVVSLGEPRETPPAPASPPPPGARAPAPRNTPDETQPGQMIEAIEWAAVENARPGSPYSGRIDLTRIAVGGHSCGGLQALSVSADPRIRTTLVLNSGIYVQPGGRSGVQIDKSQLEQLHAPLLYLSGGPQDIAHANAVDDVQRIARLPVFFGALPVGHGGTFARMDGGEWARVSARWLDWQLKGEATAALEFAGPQCGLCTDGNWTVVQKNLAPAQAAAPDPSP